MRRPLLTRLAAALVFCGVVAAPASAQFSFLGLQNSLVQFVLDQISVPGEMEITAEGVEENDDGATEIVGLQVADDEGVWMTVDRLSLRWNASRILRGELEINRLAAIGVDVKRPPNASSVEVEVKEDSELAQTDDDLFDWPRSPITTRIEQLALERVTIAPGVIAEPGIAFEATGSARDEGDEQAVELLVTRTDDVEGRILIDYLRDFATNDLRLKLEADEAPGGLVAALGGVPPEGATRVRIDGRGPLTDWAFSLDADVEDVINAQGEATIDVIGQIAVNADFTVIPGSALDPAVRRALAPEARLLVDVTEDENGVIRIAQGELRATDLSLTADGSYDRSSTIADLVVALNAGGALSELAEGVEFDGFGFDGSVKGPLDDLTADGRLTLDGLETAPVDVGGADLDAVVRKQGETINLDVSGTATALRIDRLGPDLLGEAEIAIRGVYDGASVSLDTLTFDSRPLNVSASGDADLNGQTADLSYNVAAPRLAPIAGAYDVDAGGAFRAEGQVSGPFSAIRLDGRLALEDLVYQGESYGAVRLSHDAVFDETPEGTASLRAEGSRFGEVAFDGGFLLDGSELALNDMVATGLGARIAGALDVNLDTMLMAGAIDIDAPDLSSLSSVTGQPAKGSVTGMVELSRDTGEQTVVADLDLEDIDAADVRVVSGALDATVTDALGAVNVDGELSARGVSGFGFGVEALDVTGEATGAATDMAAFDAKLSFTNADLGTALGPQIGAGEIRSGEVTVVGDLADLRAKLRAEGFLAENANVDTVSVDAHVTDAFGAVNVDGTAEATGIAALGYAVERVNVAGDVEGATTENPAFDVTMNFVDADLGGALGPQVGQGSVRSGEMTVIGDLADLRAQIEAQGFTADNATVDSVTADARVTDALGAVNVDGTAEASGVAALGYGVSRISVAGNVRGATTENPAFDVKTNFEGADLGAGALRSGEATAVGDLADLRATVRARGLTAGAASIPSLALDARVREATGGNPAIDARLTANDADLGAATLAMTTLTANGRLSALNINLDASGALETGEDLSLTTAVRADLAGAGPEATISPLRLVVGEDEIALNAPLQVTSSNGVTSFSGVDMAFPGGAMTGDATLYGNGLTGDLTINIGDLRPIGRLAGAPVDRGSLDMTARFDTRPGRANADVDVNARDLRFADVVTDIGSLGLDATLDWNGSEASVDASLTGPFGDPMRLVATAPLRATSSIVPTAPTNGALSGSVDWTGEIGEVWALVPLPGHVLAGDANIAMTLSGTVGAPEFGGVVSLSDGRYENLDTGTILVDLEANSRVEPDGAFVLDLNAEDGADGTVTARVAVADGAVDAQVNASEATLVRRDDATAVLTLDIAAAGPLAAPDISGTVYIDRAEIRLVAALPPSIADLGDVRIKGEPIPEEAPPPGGDIDLNIDVTAPQDIFVRGRGLDSEWMIALEIRGTAAAPRITGSIEKRRGRLDLLGAPLELSRGEITFNGQPEINPRLNIELTRENDGVSGGIAITGRANDPQINFVSQPALPEGEVLPRVLFGQSKQSLSPSEALQLATGVATLLDGTGGTTDSVRSALGVDVLRIEETDGGPAITVGSNITGGVFVGAKQPVAGGSGSVTVEVEIFDNFSLDSEVGPDTGTSIGLNWKKNF